MHADKWTIRTYLAKLGLPPEVADIYLALRLHGPQSISEVARHSGVERTRIYRLLDDLKASSLVEIEVKYKRNIFHAAPLGNVQALIARREQELKDLQGQLPQLEAALSRDQLASPATVIQSYQGPEGLKQMHWNQTRSRTEAVSLLYENIQIRTNLAFFERWVQVCNERGLRFRSLFGDAFVASQKQWYSRHDNERLAHWQGRYLPASVFPITYSTVVYDDVVSYYNWKDGEIFGIEIHNQQMADAQRRVFEMLWRQGVVRSES
jgi:sugar-specific transcriptional regulator TrmB